jgi:hypothetical protein
MAQRAPSRSNSRQPARGAARAAGRAKVGRTAGGRMLAGGDRTRGHSGRQVDVAQPAARVLHHGLVHLEARWAEFTQAVTRLAGGSDPMA